MSDDWTRWVRRWTDAGVIDATTARRIHDFESAQPHATHLAWPVRVALVFGGLMLGAGVLLLVAARWDNLGPAPRFLLVLALTALFHVAGALTGARFRSLAATFHALGSCALGASIFLAGQIFNLDEQWSMGFMLWAAGAWIGYALLGDEAQFALAAVLTPAWLVAAWVAATSARRMNDLEAGQVAVTGLFLLALAYFAAPDARRLDRRRWILAWTGGIALVPLAIALAAITPGWSPRTAPVATLPSVTLRVVGWAAALALPSAVAFTLRGRRAWPIVAATAWTVLLVVLGRLGLRLMLYPWWAIFALGMVAWGTHESRGERINAGAGIFAATILAFYFSEVMDKLGRSASLIGFGLLFLAGGVALERVRRRLVAEARTVRS